MRLRLQICTGSLETSSLKVFLHFKTPLRRGFFVTAENRGDHLCCVVSGLQQMQTDQAGEQDRQVQPADNRLHRRQGSGRPANGDHISVARGAEGNQTEIAVLTACGCDIVVYGDILRFMSKALSHGQPSHTGYRLRGRLWVDSPDGTFLGYGRVVLLERVREHGSISAAARSMDMSYRHAWDLIDSMNRLSRRPLVEKTAGGRGGGGAVLTAAGERAISGFWVAYRDFHEFLDAYSGNLSI